MFMLGLCDIITIITIVTRVRPNQIGKNGRGVPTIIVTLLAQPLLIRIGAVVHYRAILRSRSGTARLT